MNRIFMCSLLFLASFSFTFRRKQAIQTGLEAQQPFPGLTASNCSANRTNNVYSYITFCENGSQRDTVDCIITNLNNKFNEKWDVFAKATNSSAETSYWFYGNCSIILNNYGRYNRTYNIWLSQDYDNMDPAEDSPDLIKDYETSMRDSNCSSARVNGVNSAVGACQYQREADTVECIRNRLKSNMSEYWDVYAASSNDQSAVRYWFYDNCNLQFNNYGQYNRTVLAWKAY